MGLWRPMAPTAHSHVAFPTTSKAMSGSHVGRAVDRTCLGASLPTQQAAEERQGRTVDQPRAQPAWEAGGETLSSTCKCGRVMESLSRVFWEI